MTDPRNTEPDPAETPEVDPADFDTDAGFDLDRYHAETRREAYPFRWDGTWWELPNVYDLPTDLMELIGKEDLDGNDIVHLVVSAIGPTQWEAINTSKPLPIMATVTLFNQWMAWCGVDRGEASSSNGSSGSTAERSKRTSTRSTASGSAKRSTAPRKAASRRGKS